jgi:crossover junction endodeoxyribonuclease RuvC
MRVLGVDPGSVVCGWGLVEGRPGEPRYVAAGTIRTAAVKRGPSRLKKIHEELIRIIDEFGPATLALERHFIAANVQSAFRLGEARAMALLAVAERRLEFFEYPPNEVKLAVAGHGHADKEQIKYMVRRTLGLDAREALASDAADALAIALCHCGRTRGARFIESIERFRADTGRFAR